MSLRLELSEDDDNVEIQSKSISTQELVDAVFPELKRPHATLSSPEKKDDTSSQSFKPVVHYPPTIRKFVLFPGARGGDKFEINGKFKQNSDDSELENLILRLDKILIHLRSSPKGILIEEIEGLKELPPEIRFVQDIYNNFTNTSLWFNGQVFKPEKNTARLPRIHYALTQDLKKAERFALNGQFDQTHNIRTTLEDCLMQIDHFYAEKKKSPKPF